MKSLFKAYNWKQVLPVEIIWWVMAFLIAYAILYPITSKVVYLHWFYNGLFAVTAVLLFRYVFFFYSIPWLKPTWVRFLFFVAAVNYFIFCLHHYQSFLDMYNTFALTDFGNSKIPLDANKQEALFYYFKNETTALLVANLILLAVLIVRLVSSYWKVAKRRMDDNFNV